MIVLRGACERVDVLQFSPDGRLLAAPCEAGVQLWSDLTAGSRPVDRLEHQRVATVHFTPDGRRLVLGHVIEGARLGVLVHDLVSGKATEVPLEFEGFRMTLGLSPDGRFLVTPEIDFGRNPPGRLSCRPLEDSATALWSLGTSPIYQPPLFLAGGERFVAVEWQWEPSASQQVSYYVTRDIQTGQTLARVLVNGDMFPELVISPDGQLIAAHRGVRVAVYRAEDFTAEPVAFRNDGRKEFTGLAFHPSGRYLAATSNDATVKLYDTSTWKVAESFDWGIGRLRSVAFSPDGMLAAAGGDRGRIVVWDVDL